MIVKVSIIGATGYGGLELIRLLEHHPHVHVHSVISGSQNGQWLADLYPHLTAIITDQLQDIDVKRLAEEVDLVFFATPSGVSKDLLPDLVEAGLKCIDLSGDFRLDQGDVYRQWYNHEPAPAKYLENAVYGLSEIYAQRVQEASYIANPGCYPTAALLGLIPILHEGWIDPQSIIIDGKTGVSGAGRSLSLNTHFSETNESVKAYKLGAHQHIPEMERFLSQAADTHVNITFSAHLIPMTRGIMCTIYTNLTQDCTTADVLHIYEQFYAEHSFVRLRPEGKWPATREVYGSNYCDLGFLVDPRTNRLTIVAVIDNIVKGASGQAIQNMNLMFGWKQATGLNQIPIYP